MSHHRRARIPGRPRSAAWVGLAAGLLLAGCSLGSDSGPDGPAGPAADAALAAMAKGHVEEAAAWSAHALKQDPRNPYALLVDGMVKERQGRPALARDSYQTIVAMVPDATIDPSFLGGTGSTPRPIVEIAAARLAALPQSRVGPGMARVPGVSGPRALETPDPSPNAGPAAMQATDPAMTMAHTPSDPAWENISQRFEILKRLYDEGLVTNTEYDTRRRENLGALLPLTQDPPAAGLARPAPDADAVMGRLGDLGRSFEQGVVSPVAHAEERRAILDALLPADPARRESADMRPASPQAAARLAYRLEDALQRGLISRAAYDAEQAALTQVAGRIPAASPPPAPAPASASAPPPTPEAPAAESGSDAPADPSGDSPLVLRPLVSSPDRPANAEPGVTAGPPTANAEDPVTQRFSGVTGAPTDAAAAAATPADSGPYVHLASYREMDNARAGWMALSTRYAVLMREMYPHYEQVTIPGKGQFIRLKAGPVQIPGGAPRLCDQLRGAGQFCEPTTLRDGE